MTTLFEPADIAVWMLDPLTQPAIAARQAGARANLCRDLNRLAAALVADAAAGWRHTCTVPQLTDSVSRQLQVTLFNIDADQDDSLCQLLIKGDGELRLQVICRSLGRFARPRMVARWQLRQLAGLSLAQWAADVATLLAEEAMVDGILTSRCFTTPSHQHTGVHSMVCS